MDKNQKRLIAIVLCILGIVGTLMAVRDAKNVAARTETMPAAQVQTAADTKNAVVSAAQSKVYTVSQMIGRKGVNL